MAEFVTETEKAARGYLDAMEAREELPRGGAGGLFEVPKFRGDLQGGPGRVIGKLSAYFESKDAAKVLNPEREADAKTVSPLRRILRRMPIKPGSVDELVGEFSDLHGEPPERQGEEVARRLGLRRYRHHLESPPPPDSAEMRVRSELEHYRDRLRPGAFDEIAYDWSRDFVGKTVDVARAVAVRLGSPHNAHLMSDGRPLGGGEVDWGRINRPPGIAGEVIEAEGRRWYYGPL